MLLVSLFTQFTNCEVYYLYTIVIDLLFLQAAIFKRLSDVARLIDTSQLTEDFGGTMTYNHTLWCQFVEVGNHKKCMPQ